jgi:hypothetical protein
VCCRHGCCVHCIQLWPEEDVPPHQRGELIRHSKTLYVHKVLYTPTVDVNPLLPTCKSGRRHRRRSRWCVVLQTCLASPSKGCAWAAFDWVWALGSYFFGYGVAYVSWGRLRYFNRPGVAFDCCGASMRECCASTCAEVVGCHPAWGVIGWPWVFCMAITHTSGLCDTGLLVGSRWCWEVFVQWQAQLSMCEVNVCCMHAIMSPDGACYFGGMMSIYPEGCTIGLQSISGAVMWLCARL